METAASLVGRGLSVDVIAPQRLRSKGIWTGTIRPHSGRSRGKGVRLHLGAKVARIEGKQALLQGDDHIDADIVVVGIGVEPRLQLAKAAGLISIAASWSIRACRPVIPIFSRQAMSPDGPIPTPAKAFVWSIGSSPNGRARSQPRIC